MYDKRTDMIVHESEPYNAEPPRSGLADRMVTSLDAFYVRGHGPVPDIDAAAWRLRVDGLIDHPLEFSLAQLQQQFEEHTLVATLQCAGNRREGLMAVRDIPGEAPWGACATSTAEWTGVRLADVLVAAGVQDGASYVAFDAPDVSQIPPRPAPYGSSIPLTKARSDEVLLAWAMNGAPLAPVHGAPLRAVVPGYIGARSVKWLEHITVQQEPSDNYFQATAYRLLPPQFEPSAAGPDDGISLASVALNCDILQPDDGDSVPSGKLEVTGYAHAGDDRGVARVDVSTDEGTTWVQAALGPEVNRWTWRQWHTELLLAPGNHELVARAWDTTAATQPESAAELWNPKGYVNNSWARVHITAR